MLPPEPTGPSDVELVRGLAARDEGSLAALFDRFSTLLFTLAQRIVGRPSEAEEVVQEAFLQAWNQAERYDPSRSSVSTWLVLIVRSRALDRVRRRRTATKTVDGLIREGGPSHESPKGVSHVLYGERRKRLEEAMASLPPEQRHVLELAYYDGMTQSEIAAHTSTPLGTVKTRTSLAMSKLRDALAAEIEALL